MTNIVLDRFGGWMGKKFEATGFFRVEKDDRWWLVSPEGNAFLSFGINHLQAEFWNQDYNRKAWEKRFGLDDLNSSEFTPALKTWFLQTCQQYALTQQEFTQICRSSIPHSRPCPICSRFISLIFPIGNPKYPTAISLMYFQTNSRRTAIRWRRKLPPPPEMTPSCSVTQ